MYMWRVDMTAVTLDRTDFADVVIFSPPQVRGEDRAAYASYILSGI